MYQYLASVTAKVNEEIVIVEIFIAFLIFFDIIIQ